MKTEIVPKVKVKKNYSYIGLLYISPFIIGFLLLQLYPFIMSFYYSLTSYNVVKTPKFIGFANYVRIFTADRDFFKSLGVTAIYVLFAVPAKLAFALLIAIMLSAKLKFVNFFRTLYYLPSILGGSVAIAILWRFVFMKEGVINQVLGIFGFKPLEWLGEPSTALVTISILTVWQFGSSMVLFLAGIKQIPSELYEAGMIDGASKLRMFRAITIPMLTPIIFFNLIMQMIGAFQEFTAAFVVTNGGPMKATYLYGLMVYQQAFQFFKIGYASALSWILFVIIMALTLITFKSSSSWVHYEDGGDL